MRKNQIEEHDPSRHGLRHRTAAYRTGIAALGAVATLLMIVAVPVTASAMSPLGEFAFTGSAYGTQAHVLGGIVVSGPSAYVTLGCSTLSGVNKSNTVASVTAPPLAGTGTVTTTASTLSSAALVQSQTTAATQTVNLLNGVVTADAVQAVSTTTVDTSGFHTSAAGSTLVNLMVAGVAITSMPAPNTRIKLAGLGMIILNEQKQTITASTASLTVNMIHINITIPNSLFATGTQIFVSHAASDLEGPTMGIVDGHAYGTSANVGTVVKSGRTALVVLPCQGTDGAVLTNSTAAGNNVANLATTGTITDTATGTVGPTSASSETTSTVQGLNALSGLVTADVVVADAHASSVGPTFSDAGSMLGTIVVSGLPPIVLPVPANTQIHLLGLGTLYLHRVIQTPSSIEVRMIELVVTADHNSLDLPVGLDLRIAVAEASVHP